MSRCLRLPLACLVLSLISISMPAQARPSANNYVALASPGGSTATRGSFLFDSEDNNLTGHQPELELVLEGTAPGCDVSPGAPLAKCEKKDKWRCCRCVKDDYCMSYEVTEDVDAIEISQMCTAFCKKCGGVYNKTPSVNMKCVEDKPCPQ
jgi:hypothetical protein